MPWRPRGEVGVQIHSFFNLSARWWLVVKVPQGWSGWEQKISSPLGFDPSIVQHLVCRYTDYAILAHHLQGASLHSKRHILHQHVALSSVNGIVQNAIYQYNTNIECWQCYVKICENYYNIGLLLTSFASRHLEIINFLWVSSNNKSVCLQAVYITNNHSVLRYSGQMAERSNAQ